MNKVKDITPNYIFEISWETCNKGGSVYTALSTKSELLVPKYKEHYFFIGPDILNRTEDNPCFVEDAELLKEWRMALKEMGINVRAGYWKQASNAQTLLIDFTSYFPEKDAIFAHLWETYRLDSISGQWDYVEPTLFGYAAGEVIAHFINYHHHNKPSSHTVAHFHEWMTGAGVLYLKKHAPDVATVFTAHNTVLGHAICSGGKRLYSILRTYEPEKTARDLGVYAKFSLERTASANADAMTTVSEVTAIECEHFLENTPNVITPSGLSPSLILDEDVRREKRKVARRSLQKVAEALLNQKVADNTLFLAHSGRYDFRSKGIDMFIDTLVELRNKRRLDRDIIAWIFTPAHQLGARKRLLKRLEHHDYQTPITDDYLTHSLSDEENDTILNYIKERGIVNTPESKVKVIFVPAFLDGDDGIFNTPYFDLMTGMDFSVYPCYYEPWGYLPLESAALSVPSLTTNLSGIGQWRRVNAADCDAGLRVIERRFDRYDKTVAEIASAVEEFSKKTEAQLAQTQSEATTIARRVTWEQLLENYHEAWQIALQKSSLRNQQYIMDLYREHPQEIANQGEGDTTSDIQIWQKIFVNPAVPRSLSGLVKLSKNLWWSWNHDARDLFESANPDLWEVVERNPIKLIENISVEHWKTLEQNKDFVECLKTVEQRFDHYMEAVKHKKGRKIAYFSMEYGLDNTIKIFSGGLGMLAGDYLKEASDNNIDIIGIGLLYRHGYFQQSLNETGEQIAQYISQQFNHLPVFPERDENGERLKVSLAFPGRTLTAHVWRIDVGRIPLYLLDTQIPENIFDDQSITDQLYGGNTENRLKQELLLGVGGIRMLNKLGVEPDLYHCNEGHAAFIGIERINNLMMTHKLTFAQAKEVVRASSLFTTHTPVPAGHDYFTEDMLRTYIPHYADRLNISWNDFMNLGRFKENNAAEKFSMSVLALNLSQEANGVSKIHGRVSRELFAPMYQGYYPEEIHIGHVTNGVHLPTWATRRWQELYHEYFDEKFATDQSNEAIWQKIFSVPDDVLWNVRRQEKQTLLAYMEKRLNKDLLHRQEDPKTFFRVVNKINPSALIIGFARRFATYKRALLIFNNLDRLKEIVNNPERPVMFVFAGKAHPYDEGGKALIKRIIEISKMPDFMGKVIFLEDYDMQLAKYLISGVDIWLNTPTRPLEASGTSGEKAVMNGVVNLSVLDGWWAEGYREGAGWALPEERTYSNQDFQNDLDAERIYSMLETEIIPKFFTRNENDIPTTWLQYIRNTIAQIAPHFTMKRMLDDYIRQFYNKLSERYNLLSSNDFEKTKELTEWKQRVTQAWNKIQVISMSSPAMTKEVLSLGDTFEISLSVDLAGLTPEEVGIEVLFAHNENSHISRLLSKEQMKARKGVEQYYVYECRIPLQKAGAVEFAIRAFPQHPLLPHRMDLKLVRFL